MIEWGPPFSGKEGQWVARQWVASQRPQPGFGEPVGETTYDARPSVPASTWGREPRGGPGVGGSEELVTMRPPSLCCSWDLAPHQTGGHMLLVLLSPGPSMGSGECGHSAHIEE